ncbi:FG-GAP-like repeat-containing protein [Mangrovimonas aestuarii]|uniref:FG-GAP-like repeat-containing protein n=1 Tax=Mangrovimonas aestuarii TaxID=3018443 RepID=UPI002379616C|nr:FG-GAP-like repeat-containing protein [Mangrovimonas aestuarii]
MNANVTSQSIFFLLLIGPLLSLSQNLNFKNVPPNVEHGRVYEFEKWPGAIRVFMDYDNDGDEDVILSYPGINFYDDDRRILVFENDGSGNFTLTSNDSVFSGYYVSRLYPIDMDSDGDTDLIKSYTIDFEANSRANKIYTNNDGDFSISGMPVSGNSSWTGNPDGFLLGDVNGDGYMDLFLSRIEPATNMECNHIHRLKLYLNAESGFSINQSTTIASSDCGVSFASASGLGDIDGDNDLDLFVTLGYNNTAVYKNDGLGNFTIFSENQLPGANNVRIDFADIDNDLDMDLYNPANHALYLNDGVGNFSLHLNLSGNFSPSTPMGKFMDMNGDGNMDLALDDNIFFYDGTGTFSQTPVPGINNHYRHGQGTIYSDVDNDSDIDFVDINNDLHLNDGNGQFQKAYSQVFEGDVKATGDIDNDGDLDVISSGYNDAYQVVLYLYKNEGNNSFVKETNVPFENDIDTEAVFGDIDNDGDLDLYLSNSVIKWYLNNGLGQFTSMGAPPFGTYSNSIPTFKDIDNDGDDDVLFKGGVVFLNQGGGSFIKDDTVAFSGIAGDFKVEDFDGDNDLDVLIGITQQVMRYFTNDGTGTFAETHQINVELSYGDRILDIADVDGDGDLDIMLRENSGYSGLKLYKFSKDSGFSLATNYFPGVDVYFTGEVNFFRFADFDNDFDQDLIIAYKGPAWAYHNSFISDVYLNNGTGSFSKSSLNQFEWSEFIYVEDFDGDCDTDIFISGKRNTSSSSRKSYLYSNETPHEVEYPCITRDITIELNEFGIAQISPIDVVANRTASTCKVSSMEVVPSEFTTDDLGPNTVSLKIIHESGNESVCEAIVRVEDGRLENTVVYPNPASNGVNIQLPIKYSENDIQIKLFDVNGRITLEEEISVQGKEVYLKLDHLTDGLYFIEINDVSSGEKITKKIIKY